MKPLQLMTLMELVDGFAEPVLLARIDRPDWPVAFCNPAFDSIASSDSTLNRPLADVIEELIGRDLALEVSESVRQGQETSLPVELAGREYLLMLKPLSSGEESDERFYAAYWRASATVGLVTSENDAQQALLKAKRRIRDLTREDAVTGLLNSTAFTEVLEHDWAVAAREKSRLALVAFVLQDFDEYRAIFGKHASESCLRRVAQAIRRCLRRASDVAARVDGPDGDQLIVLSHASDEGGIDEFARQIAASVRELGLHHPRSNSARFVTVRYSVLVREATQKDGGASDFLLSLLTS